MDQLYGACSTFNKMIKFLKKLFSNDIKFDYLVEGQMAHEYSSEIARKEISERYTKLHTQEVTPFTDPLKFDPLNPPDGWVYDPYYEFWLKI